MVPFPATARAPLSRRLIAPALLVLSALALMLAIAASTMPALAGVPPTAPQGNAVPVASSATPVPTPQCTNAWEMEDIPPGQTYGRLFGMDALGPNDVWAVGGSNNNPLIEHFDGTGWTVMTPTTVITRGLLYDVSAVSANDVWAVGEHAEAIISRSGLLLHYTGTHWTKVTYPNPVTGDLLYGVDAVSSNEVWAVGSNILGAGPFVLRWNGTNWLRVTAPPLAPTSRLHAVVAADTVTTTHVWAVGIADPGSSQYPIIMHYDGAQWSTTPVAVIGALHNIVAVSPTDIWAVGTSAEPTLRTLVMHYDGVAWTRSPAPFVGELRGIHALSANHIWATGSRNSTQDSGGTTRVLHWDGTSWSAVQSPVLDHGGGTLYDVRVTSPAPDLWAVGVSNETPPARQLIARYAPVCPQPLACETGWNVVDTIDINPDSNALLGIDASAPDNVWAVGVAGLQGMANQWNGSYWLPTSISETPEETQLWGVSALAPNDVWAVGFTYGGGVADRPLAPRERRDVPLWDTRTVIVHWDGAEWTRVPSPNPSAGLENTLWGVDGTGLDDVWAVGVTNFQGLILRWDGISWTQVPLPSGVQVAYLRDVEAIAENNVWAVGSTAESAPSRTVILHWDGTTLTQIPSPNIDPNGGNYLESIDAISANDIWAVGAYEGSAGNGSLTLHWDGSQWTHVPAPSIGWLTGVSGSTANDVWAVGDPVTGNVSALHWTGSAWSVVDLPDPPEAESILWGVAAPSQNEVWAVGFTGGLFDSSSLIERYVGSCQTVTPSPSGTATATASTTPTRTATRTATLTATQPPGATVTPTAIDTPVATTTATSTPGTPVATTTSCALAFADVPPDNTFYASVRCLACQGIVSGYPCGGLGEPCNANNDPYFRPNNYVTRGQLAKIVSESAGFGEEVPPSQYTFSDVPYGSTFWVWVERLADREVMAGYPCGFDPNEPCDSANRPYFRPNAGATRGQLTKIVSNAAGFDDVIPPTEYTFADVPPAHTFWLFVERLMLNRPDVMGGYLCGGTSEPCDAQNRPYFRPNNPLTRGQTSKIVANTFFPGCDPPRR